MCLCGFLILEKKKNAIIKGQLNQFHLTSGEQSNFIDSVKNERSHTSVTQLNDDRNKVSGNKN